MGRLIPQITYNVNPMPSSFTAQLKDRQRDILTECPSILAILVNKVAGIYSVLQCHTKWPIVHQVCIICCQTMLLHWMEYTTYICILWLQLSVCPCIFHGLPSMSDSNFYRNLLRVHFSHLRQKTLVFSILCLFGFANNI